MQTRVKNRNVIRGGFYEAILTILLATRWIGMLPISGLTQCNSKLISYKWKSLYTFLCYVPSLILQGLGLIVTSSDYIQHNYKFGKLGNCIHCVINFMAVLCLLQFCIKWKTVSKKVESIEKLLPTASFRKSVIIGNWVMAGLLLFSLAEHVLFILHTIKISLTCYVLPDDSGLYIKSYFVFLYGRLFEHNMQFSYITGFLLQFSNSQAKIQSSLSDALILVVSCYLLNLFKNFNHLIHRKEYNFFSKNSKPSWIDLQIYYTRITQLVTTIDEAISPFVFISFTRNLFSAGQHLFLCLNKLTRKYYANLPTCLREYSITWESNIYTTYSILFVIARLMLVSFVAAEVHTMSRKPLYALYAVRCCYDKDLSRLMKQVYHSRICLTGLHFFYVTRGMILGMVGMLMTYELVLLQF